MATENFMRNRKSARHTRIVEYQTLYFPKSVKYDESQQKRTRGCQKHSFRDIESRINDTATKANF
jgi:hypothetical protein